MRAPVPPLKNYDDSYETILRAHPYFAQLMKLADDYNFNNYLNGKLVKMLIEGSNAINNNIYHYGVSRDI